MLNGRAHPTDCYLPLRREWNTQAKLQGRVFFFPCAGASASMYASWAGVLPAHVEGRAFRLPGHSDRYLEAPVTEMHRLVAEALAAMRCFLDRPYALFGHSLGALVCFELARELRRSGYPLPAVLVAAGRSAPQLGRRGTRLHDLPDDELVARLNDLGGIPEQVAGNRELLAVLLPAIRADLLLHERYRYIDEPPLECSIVALGGSKDLDVPPHDISAWGEQTCSSFETRIFDGDHFFVHDHREAIMSWFLEPFIGSTTAFHPTSADLGS
jgi:surfactin synthase thioesterase subunit